MITSFSIPAVTCFRPIDRAQHDVRHSLVMHLHAASILGSKATLFENPAHDTLRCCSRHLNPMRHGVRHSLTMFLVNTSVHRCKATRCEFPSRGFPCKVYRPLDPERQGVAPSLTSPCVGYINPTDQEEHDVRLFPLFVVVLISVTSTSSDTVCDLP